MAWMLVSGRTITAWEGTLARLQCLYCVTSALLPWGHSSWKSLDRRSTAHGSTELPEHTHKVNEGGGLVLYNQERTFCVPLKYLSHHQCFGRQWSAWWKPRLRLPSPGIWTNRQTNAWRVWREFKLRFYWQWKSCSVVMVTLDARSNFLFSKPKLHDWLLDVDCHESHHIWIQTINNTQPRKWSVSVPDKNSGLELQLPWFSKKHPLTEH